MEVRPGYKQTEVGVIPEDWDVAPLGTFAAVAAGGTPSRKIAAYWDGGIPWVTTTEVNFNAIVSTEQTISVLGLQNSAAKLLRPGTILLALYGQGKTRGKVATLEIEATTNQACAAIVVSSKVSPHYLFQYLANQYEAIRGLSNTGNQENLSGRIVKSLLVALPPTKIEQEAIARALSDADALIASLEQFIAKKRLTKHGAVQDLLSGQRRLQGFQKVCGYKQSEVGEYPQDWDIQKLGCIIKTTHLGGNYQNSERESPWPLIKMGNLGRGSIKLDKLEYIASQYPPDARDKLRKDDVILNTRNTLDLVGKVAIWRDELPEAYFNSNLMRLEFDPKWVGSNRFMNYILNTPTLLRRIRGMAIGTTSVAAIYSRDLVNLVVPLPTKAEQIAIAEILSDMDAEIASHEERLSKARQLKQGMMQELLTGRTRLV